MTPDDVEWADPANWYLGRLLYFAPRDSRMFVFKAGGPDRFNSMTLNFARPQSWFILGLICLPPLLMLAAFNVKELPSFWRTLVQRLGGPTAITLGLFSISFLSYGVKRLITRRREREALKSGAAE